MNSKIVPLFGTDNVPRCDERCPSFDGKRCEILGHRPDGICAPAVKEMSKALGLARRGE